MFVLFVSHNQVRDDWLWHHSGIKDLQFIDFRVCDLSHKSRRRVFRKNQFQPAQSEFNRLAQKSVMSQIFRKLQGGNLEVVKVSSNL